MVVEGLHTVHPQSLQVHRHMQQAESKNIIVLGAGIVGVATALYLQRDGHAITLIDRNDPGEGCSSGNAGFIARYSVMPLATHAALREVPSMLLNPLGPLSIRWRYLPRLLPWLLRFLLSMSPRRIAAASEALAALQRHTLEAYWTLIDQAAARDLVHANGLLFPYESEQRFASDAADRASKSKHGVTLKELSGEEARELVPALSPHIKRATFFPDCAHTVNPLRLVQVLSQELARCGARIERANIVDVEVGANSVIVSTDGDRYCSDAVVIALGAWSGRHAAALGSPVPLDTERGYHVVIPRPGVELRVPVLFPEYRFAATSMEMGLRLAGTVEFAGLDAPPNYARARVLLKYGQRLLPGLLTDDHSQWMGFRPTLPDSLPVIGRSPHHPHVYFAFGHHHLGLTLGPITGRLIADLVAGRDSGIDLTPYRIDRF
jgi:D-amino-acid dehydrogenase